MTVSPFPAAGLTRARKCEDHSSPAGDGLRLASVALNLQYRERGGAFTVSSAIYTGDFIPIRATGIASFKTETHKSRPQVRLPEISWGQRV